ncbi:MAG: 4-aminobutyrate--2-oxoglutarate transaminase [Actinobacteria bacterium]|nr:4-aminobutyrate--2-oxoglutarate transaminase [Actinomycetota bacterium]MCG2802601.1 4-aminobutyrate--2-oxoglutarate transaminase [Cellulomonas sp.]
MPTQSVAVEQSRSVRTAIPGPASLALAERRRSVVSAAVGSSVPVWAARAGGAIVEDVDGNRLIDLGAGIAVTSVGASHPAVVAAVQEQVAAFTHTCFMVTPYESYVAVAEALSRVTPGDHEKHSVLVNSGAEAVENAVKIARRATGRPAVLVLDHAYHGRTNLTMAMTAKAMPYKTGFGPFAGEIYRVPASYPLRDPAGMTGEQAARRLIETAERQIGTDQIAALVAEPILGEGGFLVPAPGFWPTLREWTTAHGIVLVADEVQSGFARTGAMFAIEHEGVVPDLITTAKGIGGGMPLAAVTGRADLMDVVHGGGLGGTFGGNPVACAAALATIDVYERENLPAAARAIEATVTARLREVATRVPAIAEVRGRGAMLALELVKPGTLEPDKAAANAVAAACLAQGVLVLTCGSWGNVIRLLPPLVIEPALLDDALDVLTAALEGLAG